MESRNTHWKMTLAMTGLGLAMAMAMPAVAQLTQDKMPDKPSGKSMTKPGSADSADSGVQAPAERGMKTPNEPSFKSPGDPKSKIPSDPGSIVVPPTTNSRSIATPPKNVDPKIDSATESIDRRNKQKSDAKTKSGEGAIIAK
jgi:hypothetical protein